MPETPDDLRERFRCLVPGCPTTAHVWITDSSGIPLCERHVQAIAAASREWKRLSRKTPARGAVSFQGTPCGGWIYYLRLGDRIKIGHTVNLRQRMAAYPPDAVLLAVEPGFRQDEQALHALFQSYRAAGREWYGAKHQPILDRVAEARTKHGSPFDLGLLPERQRQARDTLPRIH